MSRRTFMSVVGIVAFLFGLGFVLAPTQAMSSYGITVDIAAQWITRYLGCAYIGIGVLTWLAKNAEKGDGLSAVLIGNMVGAVVGIVVAVLDAVSGQGNALVWLNVVIYAFTAVGSGYYQFVG